MDTLSVDNYVVLTTAFLSLCFGVIGWIFNTTYTSYTAYQKGVIERNRSALETFFWPLYLHLIRFYLTGEDKYRENVNHITLEHMGKSLPSKTISSRLVKFYSNSKFDKGELAKLIHLVGMRCFEITYETQMMIGLKSNRKSVVTRACEYVCKNLLPKFKKPRNECGNHLECLEMMGISIDGLTECSYFNTTCL